MMNANTSPDPHRHSRYRTGSTAWTPKNSRLPNPMQVLWSSDNAATTTKRPANSCHGRGSSSSAKARSHGATFSATMMSSAPIHSASVV